MFSTKQNFIIDKATPEAVCKRFTEVVVTPDFEDEVMDIFAKKSTLIIIRVRNFELLQKVVGQRYVELKSLIDGGIIA